MRGKRSVLQEALTGHFRDHHGYLLRMMPGRVDALTAQPEALTRRIDEMIAPFAHQVDQHDQFLGAGGDWRPGTHRRDRAGHDPVPTAGHLVSWVKYA